MPLVGPAAGVWHAWVPGVKAGQRYGFRASGPWDPAQGHVYNPARLLLDPYARGIEGSIARESTDGAEATLSRDDDLDSAPFVPARGRPRAAPRSPSRPGPRIPWVDTVIYEAHVKGLTRTMPGIPEHVRGTYAALGHGEVIRYLQGLGVTTLELLPVHAFASETHLERMGLENYWGYNTLGFFAPHAAYATAAAQAKGPQAVADELRGAIAALHRGGIEVVLDVVYNHTCEGGAGGRQVSWRGLDNRAYYRHLDGQPGVLDDTTGTGNTLDFGEPRVVQMALDSLRHWITEYGVDGFRFDLADDAREDGQRIRTQAPLSRRHHDGPNHRWCQADRRAVGHGPRRVADRLLPAADGRVERSIPRLGAHVLAHRCRKGPRQEARPRRAGSRDQACRVVGRLRPRRPAPLARTRRRPSTS